MFLDLLTNSRDEAQALLAKQVDRPYAVIFLQRGSETGNYHLKVTTGFDGAQSSAPNGLQIRDAAQDAPLPGQAGSADDGRTLDRAESMFRDAQTLKLAGEINDFVRSKTTCLIVATVALEAARTTYSQFAVETAEAPRGASLDRSECVPQ